MSTCLATNIQQKLCLAAISNKEYWPGTKVAVYSFLSHNKWFDGDIVIISEDEFVKRQSAHFKNAKIVKPSRELKNAVDEVCRVNSKFTDLATRFYIIEVFGLDKYDKVIYIDSDLLFLNPIDIPEISDQFIGAVPDPWSFRGYSRVKGNCEKVSRLTNGQDCYKSFYNSGLLLIPGRFINKNYYSELIAKVNSNFLSKVKDVLADEPILNNVFENKFGAIGIKYNCSVHLLIESVVNSKVKVLHFTGLNKPWYFKSWIKLLIRNYSYLKYLIPWLYFNIKLKVVHMKNRLSHLSV